MSKARLRDLSESFFSDCGSTRSSTSVPTPPPPGAGIAPERGASLPAMAGDGDELNPNKAGNVRTWPESTKQHFNATNAPSPPTKLPRELQLISEIHS
jgi:hypothetical protein